MRHDVEVKRVLGKTKAVPPKQRLNPREEIRWTVPNADAGTKSILFFPHADAVFGTPVTQEFDPVGGLTLTAKDGAPKGGHKYTIYCIIDGEEELAEGLSPPQVIID